MSTNSRHKPLQKSTVKTSLPENGLTFYDCLQAPFRMYGVFDHSDNDRVLFHRLPTKVAVDTSKEVTNLSTNTTGGRLRFKTDSAYVAIHVKLKNIIRFSHMPLSGTCGFDLYEHHGAESRYVQSLYPPFEFIDEFEAIVHFPERRMRDLSLNFPIFSGIESLYIGLEESAAIEEGGAYSRQTPLLFYGSSITHGGCASRPGNTYPAIISRKLDSNYINLGFSGSARGEDAMAEYISEQKMSIFIYDYDHNAPTTEHLKNTHEKLFLKLREKQPDLPVLFVSKPDFNPLIEEHVQRREIILETFHNAIKRGDKNIDFVDGESLFNGPDRDSCTVDGCHPNDLGFRRMAEVIAARIQILLSR